MRIPDGKRLRDTGRRAFAGLSLAFLIAWAVAAVFWVRSYWVETRLHRAHRRFDGVLVQRQDSLSLRRGRFYFDTSSYTTQPLETAAPQTGRSRFRARRRDGTTWRWDEVRPPTRWGVRGQWGFARLRDGRNILEADGATTYARSILMVPWGVVMAALGATPVYWLVLSRRERFRRKRRQAGLCVRCGYDLRASPDRCPECGEPTPALSRAPAQAPAPTG